MVNYTIREGTIRIDLWFALPATYNETHRSGLKKSEWSLKSSLKIMYFGSKLGHSLGDQSIQWNFFRDLNVLPCYYFTSISNRKEN